MNNNMLQSASVVLTLFLFWVLLSGYFTAFLLGAGAACAVAVLLFSRRMHIFQVARLHIRPARTILVYWPWLMVEIAKSAWTVSSIIVNPRLPISPTLIGFRPTQRTAAGLVVHANSITLTPGTIAVRAEPDEFVVHALTREGALAVVDSEMDRRCSRCEAAP